MSNPPPAYFERMSHGDGHRQTDGSKQSRGHLSDVEQRGGGFDFRHAWHSLQEKLWIVVLCVVAGLFLSLGYLARTPKMYEGYVVLEVDIQDPTAPLTDGAEQTRIRSMFLASQDAMRTIEQSFTNRALLTRVIRSEGLAQDGGRALLGETLYVKLTKELRENQVPNPTPPTTSTAAASKAQTETALEEALATQFEKKVKAQIRRGTRLIDLTVTNEDPAIARRLTEAVAREYIRNAVERRTASNQETLGYLFEEEERLKANLQKSEADVAEYKAKTPDALQLGGGAGSTGSQVGAGSTGSRGGLVEDKLQDLTGKLTAAKAQRLQFEGELQQIEQVGDDVEKLLAFPRIASTTAVTDRRRELAEREAALGVLTQRYKEKHPKLIAGRAALGEAQANLRRTVLSQPAVLRNAIEQARATENNLTAAVHEQEKAALALNKAAIGYQELARQAETDRALYENVLKQIKETNLTKDVKTNAVTIVEHSPLPRKPVSPSPLKAVMLGLVAGVFFGLAWVLLSDAMDRSLKTVDQTEGFLGLPVLSAIPEVKREDRAHGAAPTLSDEQSTYRLMAEAPEGPAAEAFRTLRAALSLLGQEADRKVFIFTSASPEEGKSFTSANYALSLAQQGQKVLLIDADLRRPTLHKIFRPGGGKQRKPGEQLGIVDYMVGTSDLRSVIRQVSSPRILSIIARKGPSNSETHDFNLGELWLIAGGRRAPNPAELLSGGSAFATLLAEARTQFDRIIIDSAPVLAVSDTLIMTPHVQSICLVIRAAKTPRQAVQRAVGLLAGAGTPPVGIVLNRLPRQRGSDYYYYYASHGYGEGEGSYADHYRPTIMEHHERAAARPATAGSKNGPDHPKRS